MAKDAFAQGRLAFQNNFPMSSCEFPVGSSLRAEWMSGWNEARNADPKSAEAQGGHDASGQAGAGVEAKTPIGHGSVAAEFASHRPH